MTVPTCNIINDNVIKFQDTMMTCIHKFLMQLLFKERKILDSPYIDEMLLPMILAVTVSKNKSWNAFIFCQIEKCEKLRRGQTSDIDWLTGFYICNIRQINGPHIQKRGKMTIHWLNQLCTISLCFLMSHKKNIL